jgi:hypothetical protein
VSKWYVGGCLCGGVRYEYSGVFTDFIYCHCQDCRKASGSAFNANAAVDRSGFRLLQGTELLRTYSASLGKQRVFCGTCGSPLYSCKDWEPDTLGLRMGTLDTALETGPKAHQFVASRARWYRISDELPQYPQRIVGVVPRDRERTPRSEGETTCS